MNKVLMLGIGGVGMRRLAELYIAHGYSVVGFDIAENEATRYLQSIGVIVNPKNFELDNTFDKVIFSSAIPLNDPIIEKAKAMGIQVKRRGEALAEIVNGYRNVVIAGTHGKTTTTSLIAWILSKRYRVNAYIGGTQKLNEGFVKDANFFVVESDESDKTFLLFKGDVGVVTNIDRDHLNTYNWDFNLLKNAFREFMLNFKSLVVNFDNNNAYEVSKSIVPNGKIYYYSLNDQNQDIFVRDYRLEEDGISFTASVLKENTPRFKIKAYGLQNLSNALASILVARLMGLSFDEIDFALSNFEMPKRRIEFKGNINSLFLFDDHADHPTEVEATLKALRSHFPNRRIIAIFQPHRYTRLFSLKEDIARPFYLADSIIVLPIYTAFENPIEGITNENVFNWIKMQNIDKNVFYAPNFDAVANLVLQIARPSDIVITLGPGDVHFALEKIRVKLKGEQ